LGTARALAKGYFTSTKKRIPLMKDGKIVAISSLGSAAAYGTVREFANILGQTEHVSLLEETLEEEKETDEKLTQVAKQINTQANEESDQEGENEAKAKRKAPRRVA